MKNASGWLRFFMIFFTVAVFALTGCSGDDGDDGPPGPPGPPGSESAPSFIIGQWQQSGHADATAEAFIHWDEEGEVPTSCARCHSTEGFVSFTLDGTIEEPAPTGEVITCKACHSSTLYADEFDFAGPPLEPVPFPSGVSATLNGPSNICMVCHQGRASKVQVDQAIAADPNGTFSFINIHYYAAAASFFGTEVQGGYEYEGKQYVGQFTHVPSRDNCVECHMPMLNHTFEPQPDDCARCHAEVDEAAEEPFQSIRRDTSVDYDGDGDSQEGLYFEINDTLAPALLNEIQEYAATNLGVNIVYNPASHPYFFVDDNANRTWDEGEVTRFSQFDAPLLQAAYNYQVIQKEPCGYIHNAKYMIQLLYDSIEALGGDVAGFRRPDDSGTQLTILDEWQASGHADVTGEPFNHWNEDVPMEIPADCAKCHSEEGFRDFAVDGSVENAAPVQLANGQVSEEGTLVCSTCHVRETQTGIFTDPATLWDDPQFTAMEPVPFPSGATQTLNGPSNMCMSCHQGRASGVDVQQAIDEADLHERFTNRHYFAAAAILFGSEVTAHYEYPGRTYLGQNTFPGHGERLSVCVDCHMRSEAADHTFAPRFSDCNGCHQSVVDNFEQLGLPFGQASVDYDGDGTGESFQGEIDGFAGDGVNKPAGSLLTAIQNYAATVIGTEIEYRPGSYPYFFIAGTETSYNVFDDRLLAAGFNFHSAQDPCSDLHNYQYVLQALYDSLDDLDDNQLNNSVTGTRPGDGEEPPPGENQPPVANAGTDQTDVAVGSPVQLDGSASSDPEGTQLTYNWTVTQAPEGSTAALVNPTTANPTFTPDVAGSYTIQLEVSDGEATATDTVTVLTAGEEPPPVEPPTTVIYQNGFGNITFNHTNHETNVGDCASCHTTDPPQSIEVDNTGQGAAHGFCGQCHTQPTAGPCNFCHGN